ncbi:MAG: GrdB-related putative oxidoreductase [Clostridium sp.]|uniref:GrdB-related putative oxidoreductase n=1 Tax=Clostridium sp. TaxID=1506 RepID=UPI003EE4FAFB
MRVVMIFDQVQAGLGGKENPNLPLGGKSISIGAASMLEDNFKDIDAKVVGCLYCGDGFFDLNEELVKSKFVGMVKKLNADFVICGPAYDYKGYGRMCASIANEINEKTDIIAVAAMSKENEKTIEMFKDKIDIVKMPKKGGIGLSKSLKNICVLGRKRKDNSSDLESFVKEICY